MRLQRLAIGPSLLAVIQQNAASTTIEQASNWADRLNVLDTTEHFAEQFARGHFTTVHDLTRDGPYRQDDCNNYDWLAWLSPNEPFLEQDRIMLHAFIDEHVCIDFLGFRKSSQQMPLSEIASSLILYAKVVQMEVPPEETLVNVLGPLEQILHDCKTLADMSSFWSAHPWIPYFEQQGIAASTLQSWAEEYGHCPALSSLGTEPDPGCALDLTSYELRHPSNETIRRLKALPEAERRKCVAYSNSEVNLLAAVYHYRLPAGLVFVFRKRNDDLFQLSKACKSMCKRGRLDRIRTE